MIRPPVWSISRVMDSAVTDLPEPELAHDRQRLAFANVQVQFAHHGRNAVIGGKANAQPLDIKQFPRLRQRRIPLRVMTH